MLVGGMIHGEIQAKDGLAGTSGRRYLKLGSKESNLSTMNETP